MGLMLSASRMEKTWRFVPLAPFMIAPTGDQI
jgi:hypothetical protein